MLKNLEKELQKYASKQRGILLQRYFKTGPGDYGEGDIFLGLTMGINRELAKRFKDLSIQDIQSLLDTKIHEKRMIALLILIDKYKCANKEANFLRKTSLNKELHFDAKRRTKSELSKKEIFDFYLRNTKNINNWDLVDLSAPNIIGNFLIDKERKVLYELAISNNLWEKRISIISCFAFIRNNDFEDSLKISEILLEDSHDLIHKAVGWMLREVGKKNQEVEEMFLKKHYKNMPRTMLRYAIERFEEGERKRYLKGEI